MEDSGIDSDPKNLLTNGDDLLFQGNVSDSSSGSNNTTEIPRSNVKQLHRKLEQRIQEAKKLQKSQQQQQQQQEQKKSNLGPNLIPIQRLSIPSKPVTVTNKEHLPLVDWDTDDSDEDIHFFPVSKSKAPVRQELTDTFSIEEFQLSPDEDDLNLLPPKPTYQRFTFCCYSFNSKCSIL